MGRLWASPRSAVRADAALLLLRGVLLLLILTVVAGPGAQTAEAMVGVADCSATGCHPGLTLDNHPDVICGTSGCHDPYNEGDFYRPFSDAYHTEPITATCTGCHSATFPAVPRHTDAELALLHEADIVGCTDCHEVSLISEHDKDPTFACQTCHSSTDPVVLAAIAAQDAECAACHDVASGHEVLHEPVTVSASCDGTGCHVGTNLIPIHANSTCATCHDSTDPNVIAAIATIDGDFACENCHPATDHTTLHEPVTVSASCDGTGCHVGTNLIPIHANSTCATCHDSTDPNVIAAIATIDGDFACENCHAATDHETVHDVTVPAGCSGTGCHTATNLVPLHPTGGCAGCHDSTDQNVIEAIAGGDTSCEACHAGMGSHEAEHEGIADPTCTTCHGSDSITLHGGCDVCHSTTPPAGATCTTCHDDLSPEHGAIAGTKWWYKDLSDAERKYEGGYDCVTCHGSGTGPSVNPHGGYDTSTNKCKVCHAVHRAEGAYYLLRADSQDDACDYCHIGGSAHSSKVVYDLNSAGKATNNGHTIGASTYIPDSTVSQWTEEVTLETVNALGNPLSEVISVRAYDEDKNDMYRFARHHGHSEATGSDRRNYLPVGPLALRCMSCHQVHNAEAQTWQTISMASMGDAGEYLDDEVSSYKLLKQFPSGTFVGGVDSRGQIPLSNISLVPETTLTAGVNFDSLRAMGAEPTALSLVRGSTSREYNKPMWVAQDFDGEHDRNAPLAEQSIASSVNNAALSVWCADCHNLNIGGWKHLDNEELGFKAHTERTHPAPFTGAHSGPGQCYSCHRNDLPRINAGDSCSQCHYGTGNYKENRAGDELVASDFPHSGEDNDYKMLGSYSIVPITDYGDSATTIDDDVTVGPNNLDAVCLRCHGGIGTYH